MHPEIVCILFESFSQNTGHLICGHPARNTDVNLMLIQVEIGLKPLQSPGHSKSPKYTCPSGLASACKTTELILQNIYRISNPRSICWNLLFLLLRTWNEVTIIVKRSDPMRDTKISSCKYCQCDIEGHQTWSSPQIHCLERIKTQRQQMWFQAAPAQVTGLLPFHGLSICTQQSAHCHLKRCHHKLEESCWVA